MTAVLLVTCLGLTAPGGSSWARSESSQDPDADSATATYSGRRLSAVLAELRDAGLDLLWSDLIVSPDLEVTAEPRATDVRDLAEELLRAHGLGLQAGPGGTLTVIRLAKVAASTPASLSGSVRSRRGLGPVVGAFVRVLESGDERRTDEDGRFEIDSLAAGTYTLEARHPGFVVEQRQSLVIATGTHHEISITLQPTPLSSDEIVVSPSRISLLLEEPAAPLALSRDDMLALPHLGGDFFRAITLMPGTTGNDVSAGFHVRGGRRDEVQILLDGQELYDAYHLKDFDDGLSIVADSGLQSMALSTGAYQAEYGDRMSGVLDLTTTIADSGRQYSVGLSILTAQFGSSGTFDQERANWLASLRRGSVDLASRVFGGEDPEFWDAFGKLDYRVSPANSLRLSALQAQDKLNLTEDIDGETKLFDTDYSNAYLWGTHQSVLSDVLYIDTVLSTSAIDRDRTGVENDVGQLLEIADIRRMDVFGILQSWNLQAGASNFLLWGLEGRRFDSDYDYFNTREFSAPIVPIEGEPPDGVERFVASFRDDYYGGFLTDQVRVVEPLTLALGLRYDQHSLTDDELLSPRINMALATGATSALRIGWGHFFQSQRAYELQVADGETEFHKAERSEQVVVGFEHTFRGDSPVYPLALRVEAYSKTISDPRPRYENLFEAINIFPEAEPDRFRIVPESSSAEGVEVYLRGRFGPRVGWWANYAYANTEDRIDAETIRREIDQTHALNLDLNFRPNDNWNLNFAWRYHTGWPTTPISLVVEEDPDGEDTFRLALGPLNSLRLPEYHRLDFRASRRWSTRRGSITFFLDAQNLYDRENVAGFDIEVDEDEQVLIVLEDAWPGIFPSLGVTWEF